MSFSLTIQGYREASAEIDGDYRYVLRRAWAPSGDRALICMLNPSTADALDDDPTIRRCIGLTRDLGFTGFTVVNLFALRATDPKEMLGRGAWAIGGTRNIETWHSEIAGASVVIAAWGVAKTERVERQAKRFREACGSKTVFCFGTTASGDPRHPLYLRSGTKLVVLP